MMSGPMAKPRTKTETTKLDSRREDVLKVSRTSGTPGANIDEASGVTKVMAEQRPIFSHFFRADQFCGLAGSSGPSHQTRLSSSSGDWDCSTTGTAVQLSTFSRS